MYLEKGIQYTWRKEYSITREGIFVYLEKELLYNWRKTFCIPGEGLLNTWRRECRSLTMNIRQAEMVRRDPTKRISPK